MAKVPIPIGGGSYVDDSLQLSSQKVVNCYVERPQTQTISEFVLKANAGLVQLASVSDIDTFRGNIEMAEKPYFVIGSKLYRLDRTISGGVATYSTVALGTIAGSGFVSMDTNGEQIVIVVPGSTSYTYTVADGLVAITDANFDGPADWVEYISGFFVFGTSTGKKALVSPVNDARGTPNGTAYDPLDFFTAEADPDQMRGAINLNNTLYVFGTKTTQAFQVTDRVPAPIVPIPGAVFPKGLAGAFTVVKTQSSFAMIGAGENESPAVWEFTGNGYSRMSHSAIEQTLEDLSSTALDTLAAWSYAKAGAFLVGFTLPETAFVYNTASQRWTNQESTVDEQDYTYRALGMLTAYEEVLVGDNRSGIIGRLDVDTYTEYGENVKRQLITRPFDNQGDDLPVSLVEAVCQMGVGNGTVEDPQIRLSTSNDGGMTYGNEKNRPIGKVGVYKNRARWYRQGRVSRCRTMKFEYSEPTPFTLIKVEADVG